MSFGNDRSGDEDTYGVCDARELRGSAMQTHRTGDPDTTESSHIEDGDGNTHDDSHIVRGYN